MDADTLNIANLHNEDEGNYVYNVRNYIIENRFFKDDTNFILLSPLYSFFVFIFVKILGISIFSFRFTSAFFGLLSILLIYKITKNYSKVNPFIPTALLSSDFLFNIHSRIAMPEITASFFFLLTISIYLNALKKQNLRLYFLTGLFSGLGFLIKSNAAIIIFVGALFEFILYVGSNIQNRTKTLKNILKRIASAYLMLASGFIIPITLWYFFIIKPNSKYFNLVNIGLIQLHKPQIKAQLLNKTFLWNELKEFVIGGEGKIWIYLLPYFLTIMLGFILFIKNKKYHFNKLFFINLLWFFIGNIYFYVLWYKPARWYIPNVIPLIIITSFFISKFPAKLKAFTLTTIIGINLLLNFNFIYSNPTYYLKSASKKVETIVENNTYAGDSLVLMENNKAKAYNPYFIQNVYTSKTFNDFLTESNYPTYLVVFNNQYNSEIEKSQKYTIIYNDIQSSNLEDTRVLNIYQKN